MKAKNCNVWHAVMVLAKRDAEVAVENAFSVMESIGTEIDALGSSEADVCRVIGYFDSEPDPEFVKEKLSTMLEVFGVDSDAVLETVAFVVEESDWLSEWKKHWNPTPCGPFCVFPSWQEPDDRDLIPIRIDPSMAFGTGTHETTRLCLSTIARVFQPGWSFLDVGTGTGILAIAAAKLGARDILAIDTDPDSVGIAEKNAGLNQTEWIRFETGTLKGSIDTFDLVCANITIDVLVPMLPQLLEVAGKKLILSGILAEQESVAREALLNLGFGQVATGHEGEWIAVIVDKN